MNPPKLRISYSLLSCWLEGKTDEAVKLYFHVDHPVSRPMREGSEIHDQIAKHVDTNKILPDFMPPLPLVNPVTEVYHKVSYNELFDLSAKFDLQDPPIIAEWKTGVTDSLEWARTIQIPFYFLICELEGIKVEKAYLAHYNQHNHENDWIIVWNGKLQRDRAENVIQSVGPEIYQFFLDQGLL